MLCKHCGQFFDDDDELNEHHQQEQMRMLIEFWRNGNGTKKPAQGEADERREEKKA